MGDVYCSMGTASQVQLSLLTFTDLKRTPRAASCRIHEEYKVVPQAKTKKQGNKPTEPNKVNRVYSQNKSTK